MILTDAQGRPIEKPRREDFADSGDYLRAFHAYKDTIAREANAGFEAGWREAMARKT